MAASTQERLQAQPALSESKKQSLLQLSTMSEETLAFLAELSVRPGIEIKLKANKTLLKMYL